MGHQLIARALRAQRRGDGREAAHGLESLLEVFVPQLIYQYLDGRQGILPLPINQFDVQPAEPGRQAAAAGWR